MATEISDWNDLDNVRNDLTGDYVLVNDLDSETDGYAGVGDDWEGDTFRDFTGTFNGDGFEIRDLDITAIGSGFDGEGLFANINDVDSVIENLHVDGVIEGPDRIGLLCGRIDAGTIKNCSGSGQVINTGGETGHAFIGRNDDIVENCVSHVDVTSDGQRVGGLVGQNRDTVTDSYATGSVEGGEDVGGLVGQNNDTVTESYATGSVAGDDNSVGGLVGRNFDTVTDSYATGSVEGNDEVGGLVGRNSDTVTDSYATGSVEGNDEVGGLVGRNTDTVTDSYWDTETSGQSTSDGDATGLTTAEMQGSEAETNMDGFDFENVWSTVEGDTETDTINGQITLDETAAETATVILHNFSKPESVEGLLDGYPILLSVDEGEQLESRNTVVRNIARTETDTDGNYSAEIPGAAGDTIAVGVDFDDGTDRYGRLITTVIE